MVFRKNFWLDAACAVFSFLLQCGSEKGPGARERKQISCQGPFYGDLKRVYLGHLLVDAAAASIFINSGKKVYDIPLGRENRI